jgi:hypothetical protein
MAAWEWCEKGNTTWKMENGKLEIGSTPDKSLSSN